MTTHKIGTREEWLKERLDLLEAEKELTRRSDELAQRRRELPWVRIDKEYHFETERGTVGLTDLFHGRSQLMVYHFMFGPDYEAGCASCSMIADCFNGFAVHLANHDVLLTAVSRAPLAKLQAFKKRMGWIFPWASSHGGDFNYDFNVSITPEQQRDGGTEYNYRRGGHVIEAAQLPPIVSDFVQTPTPLNPLGAKGIGEGGAIGVPAAIASAVADALGRPAPDPPFTPEKLWRALRGMA